VSIARNIISCAALLLVIVRGAGPVVATTIVAADLRELTVGATAVAHAVVVDTRSQWVGNRERVETLVTLDVESYFKGNLGRQVVIRVPGGQIGRYRSVLIGAPHLRHGDELVLFLGSQRGSLPYVLGLSQGVFRVRREAGSNRAIVTPAPLLARGNTAEQVIRGDRSRRPLSLSDFGDLVRSLAEGRPASVGALR
jgi:hypothetical protein